ncbi:exported hypothetical protein [Rhodospirillaceae bacterium LM-1]|nr:exported hypothetical protein [Rhodospirillaceae bacterium LM-1]
MKRLGLLLSLLLLVSCGPPMAWDKPGLSPEARANDRTDCERLAWRQAVDVENDLMFQYRMSGGATRYALRHGYYPQPNFDRYGWEDRFYSTCMQAKGYRLVPINQGG